MFIEIERANRSWLASRSELLSDAAVLLSQVDDEQGRVLGHLADRIATLDDTHKADVLKAPMFVTSLHAINGCLVGAYADDSPNLDDLRATCAHHAAVLCKVAAGDSAFARLPRIGGIRLVVGSLCAMFVPDATYGVELDSEVDEERWLADLREALAYVQLDPVNASLVSTFISYVVPLKQRTMVQNLSFSSRQHPNVVFKNNEQWGILCGETLVHEADHQFFYALEEGCSFWLGDIRLQKPLHLSPWRDDPRPLDGILRGLSAFTRVATYHSRILSQQTVCEQSRVGTLLLRRIVECEVAQQTLHQSGELSQQGRVYVDELAAALTDADARARRASEYAAWRMEALKGQAARREAWLRAHGGVMRG